MSDTDPPTIVLGMHRSGTSLLTGTLEAAGIRLGDVNIAAPFNKKGNRELESLRQVHDRMLLRAGCSWRAPPDEAISWEDEDFKDVAEILESFRGTQRWAFKDPRTIWLLDGYLGLFPGARLIAIAREPTAVAASLAARPGELHLPLPEGLELWRRTNERLLVLWHRYKFPILRFSALGPQDPLFSGPLARFMSSAFPSHNESWREHMAAFFDRDLVNQTGDGVGAPNDCCQLWERLLVAMRLSGYDG